MSIDFTEQHTMAAVRPYLHRVLSTKSAEGRAILRSSKLGILSDALRNLSAQFVGRRKVRNSRQIAERYSDSYATSLASLKRAKAPDDSVVICRLGRDQLLEMSGLGLRSAHLAAIETAVVALRPASICEVGFGTGRNLFYLAPRYPEIKFSGYELAASGVAVAHEIQRQPSLTLSVPGFVGPWNAEDEVVVRSIDFQQGDATALPAADKSVDMVVTVLALEQMADILPQALSEIRRIARRHVVFLEPFRDANDIVGLLHLRSRNYFRASQKDIAAAGFRPISMVLDLPHKLAFGASMLVAEVR